MDTLTSAHVAAEVRPRGAPITASMRLPGSKSVTNRVLLMALSAEGRSVISDMLLSQDTHWALLACEALGATVTRDGTSAAITGIGRRRPVRQGEIHVGAAGTLARFLPGILAAGDPGHWRLTADEQMMRRPVGTLVEALRGGGAEVEILGPHGGYPLSIRGGTLRAGALAVPGNVSSQFISGAMMAGPLLDAPLVIRTGGDIVQSDYVRITVDAMARFGAEVEIGMGFETITVAAGGYRPRDLAVDADASTATYFAAMPAILGGEMLIPNLRRDSIQPDIGFLDVLARMGCTVTDGPGGVRVARDPSSPLKGGFTADMRPLSDSALTLAACAVFADAPIAVTGIEHIRNHECDRVDAMTAALRAFGIAVAEHPDGWTITPGTPRFAEIDSRDDHRMAMSTSLIAMAGAGARISEPACVGKTCPAFFEMVAGLGVEVLALT